MSTLKNTGLAAFSLFTLLTGCGAPDLNPGSTPGGPIGPIASTDPLREADIPGPYTIDVSTATDTCRGLNEAVSILNKSGLWGTFQEPKLACTFPLDTRLPQREFWLSISQLDETRRSTTLGCEFMGSEILFRNTFAVRMIKSSKDGDRTFSLNFQYLEMFTGISVSKIGSNEDIISVLEASQATRPPVNPQNFMFCRLDLTPALSKL